LRIRFRFIFRYNVLPSGSTSVPLIEIAENNGAAGKVKIEGYKIVNGEKPWMGTLLCDYRSADQTLPPTRSLVPEAFAQTAAPKQATNCNAGK
jgi:hypothetical protein